MRFINLCTLDNSYEANYIREALAEAGIECMVTNENFTNLMPHMNGMLGSGIQILVDKDDLETARQIVEKRTKREVTTCPHCDSKNINYGLGTTRRSKKIIAILISFLTGSPTRHIKPTYYCNDCKAEFGK
jgi:DNA-directed RNA polymerase subunit RPC12/RpoP